MKPFVGGKRDETGIGAADLDRRDKAKIVMVTVLGGAVLFAGETVSELFYVPLYVLIAAAFVWQRLRQSRRNEN